jgi:hypothetical protein
MRSVDESRFAERVAGHSSSRDFGRPGWERIYPMPWEQVYPDHQ